MGFAAQDTFRSPTSRCGSSWESRPRQESTDSACLNRSAWGRLHGSVIKRACPVTSYKDKGFEKFWNLGAFSLSVEAGNRALRYGPGLGFRVIDESTVPIRTQKITEDMSTPYTREVPFQANSKRLAICASGVPKGPKRLRQTWRDLMDGLCILRMLALNNLLACHIHIILVVIMMVIVILLPVLLLLLILLLLLNIIIVVVVIIIMSMLHD